MAEDANTMGVEAYYMTHALAILLEEKGQISTKERNDMTRVVEAALEHHKKTGELQPIDEFSSAYLERVRERQNDIMGDMP